MADPIPHHSERHHTHGSGVRLDPPARAILARGLQALLDLSEGLAFAPLPSARYPLPLARAVYGRTPDPAQVRAAVQARLETDPISVLEEGLVLLELYAGHQPAAVEAVPDDARFLSQTFQTKRQNGWIGLLGEVDAARVQAVIEGRWRFGIVAGPPGPARIYPLLNMVARHAFVYGQIAPGDSHAMGHFVEDYAPALFVCWDGKDDLSATLALAALKLGLPAVVPDDYPFELGRQLRIERLDQIDDSLIAFPNMHRLLDMPGIPPLPDYLDPAHVRETIDPVARWGDSPESFYMLRKGPVDGLAVTVLGEPAGPMGVILTADAEPLDAFDRRYIEGRAAQVLSQVRGAMARVCDGQLWIDVAAESDLSPTRVGEVLVAAVRHEFPKIEHVQAEVIFERAMLRERAAEVRAALAARADEIASTGEEDLDYFATCVGCSPFAPDHACILTPQRPPQCSRRYERIKTGALYGYDDMTDIHHRMLHAGLNSFGVCERGEALDPVAGEWAGVNTALSRLTGGRTTRVQLHALDQAPHTGCSCFQLIMFETDQPRPGIGIMQRGYEGQAPDGRTWRDLHYALTGKQMPGMAGASPLYLRSEKFLAAHGGWAGVVWVSPRVAAYIGDDLPDHVVVGA